MALGNRYMYTIFLQNEPVLGSICVKYFLFQWGGEALPKIVEKHALTYTISNPCLIVYVQN